VYARERERERETKCAAIFAMDDTGGIVRDMKRERGRERGREGERDRE